MTIVFEKLTRRDIAAAADVLADALMVEPGFAHILPNERDRRSAMGTMMRGITTTAVRGNSAWVAREGDTVLGVAVLAAPGAYPSSRLELLRSLPRLLTLIRFGPGMLRDLNAFDHNAHTYFPTEPCWYLQALGVSPAAQGKGVGSGLLRAILAETTDAPCYLETGTEANVRLYQRFGFEIVESAAQLAPNNGPTHWTMLRPVQ